MPLVSLDTEMTTGQSFHDFALNLNEIVSCHSVPFRRCPVFSRSCATGGNDAIRIAMHANFVDMEMPALSSLTADASATTVRSISLCGRFHGFDRRVQLPRVRVHDR